MSLRWKNGKLVALWPLAFGVKVKRLGNGQVQHAALTTLIDLQWVRRMNYFGDAWSEKEALKDIANLDKAS